MGYMTDAKDLAGKLPEGEAMPIPRAYGCVFCTTGKERVVAERLQQVCPEVRAVVARQEKHKSHQGKKSKVTVTFLPSYVFFEAAEDFDPYGSLPREHVIRVLRGVGGTWRLAGEDLAFARWLFGYGGVLRFSKACKEGDRIRIISGPLKDMEGRITRMD